MKKHLWGLTLTFLVAVGVLLDGASLAEAGSFVQVADTGVLELKSNRD